MECGLVAASCLCGAPGPRTNAGAQVSYVGQAVGRVGASEKSIESGEEEEGC